MGVIRLQKFITDCGIMSRRKAEEQMLNGNIKVNDKIVTLGTKIDPLVDIVTYNGQTIKYNASNEKYIYIKLFKPVGYVTTTSDEKGRKNVTDLIKDVNERVYPIGRLDMYSEGLLILTNDGELTNKLTHPSYHIPKQYKLKVVGSITDEQYNTLISPMSIDNYDLKPIKAFIVSRNDISKDGQIYSTLKITLNEGRNRQIRKMCEKAGLKVLSLKRISIGEITLGNLKPGEWTYLTNEELNKLKG